MGFIIPEHKTFQAFAMIVDINGFTPMVKKAEYDHMLAQYVRDVLTGGIVAVERADGHVVSFMGDAFLALLLNPEEVFNCCYEIAKDVDKQCEYISNHQEEFPDEWYYAPGGPSLKITIEYGDIIQSTISSNLLGNQKLFIGSAINYAARIGSAGTGNRCILGPAAAKQIQDIGFALSGPGKVNGKKGEPDYTWYHLDLGDTWREGDAETLEESYWG